MSRAHRIHPYTAVTLALGTAFALTPALAQDAGKVMIDVTDCIKLEAPAARLACYESRVAAVFGERAAQAAAARSAAPAPPAPERASAAPSAPPPAAARTVAAAPASVPAASEPAQSRRDRPSRREEKEQAAADIAASEIVSRVKEVRQTVPQAYLITLENGQVWRQTVPKEYELRPGQQVRIYGTRWGTASRLAVDQIGGYIQVEQVR